MTVDQYLDNIIKRYKLGNATEHTFRGDLQQLLESIEPNIRATNEPKRQSCGAPDYILTKKEIPVGFIEAKDIGDKDLDGTKKTGNKEQFDRYKASLNNLIFTDYLDFHLYIEGVFIIKIAIAEIAPSPSGKTGDWIIIPQPHNFSKFTNLIKDFCAFIGQNIKSSKKLAEMMAGKARLLSDVIEMALLSDETHNENSTLKDQMNAFKQILIHDITPKGFADVYAQTIAYGMFAARLHDPTLPTFSRQEAAELIPKSNPFLRKLFGYIAGPDLDDRIKWIVDSLIDIFLACNVEEILKNYGQNTKMEDPIIHFYETFLSEYDPKLRKARGVWYTPAPVVNFIVRAVDDILKTEFDLPNGLADNSKTKIKVDVQGKKIEQEVHKVQILDPATGTGTFLAEVVKHIHKKFEGQKGIWSNYVETHLLPRLNGFELLMASYAMAHLQLDLLLTETGYKPSLPSFGGAGGGRLRVYLTNSLEESHPDTGTLFANWLSSEANEANHIKRDTPVMCVIGNPPYAVSSTNKSEWIQALIDIYKANLNERKINIDDDYIKFIRYGQHYIDKNGSGILAYISNNSFIDGVTHRQMRHNLLLSFDKIYILDLHGNAKKKEVCANGSADQNVFDIMQGVSINIFIKTGKKNKNELGKVFSYDLQGKRDFKYETLLENSIKSIKWNELQYKEPYYFFVPKNFIEEKSYDKGFKVNELFINNNTGIQTKCDELSIQFEQSRLKKIVEDFKTLDIDDLKKKYPNKTDSSGWNFKDAVSDLKQNEIHYTKILYRPFDIRFTLYTGKSSGFIGRPRTTTMAHMVNGDNLGLITLRLNGELMEYVCLITDHIIEKGSLPKGNYSLFPLYLYPEISEQQTIDQTAERTPNLNLAIVKEIAEKLGVAFANEKTPPSLPKGEGQNSFGRNGEVILHSSYNNANPINSLSLPKGEGQNSFGRNIDPHLQAGYVTANPNTYRHIKEMRDDLKDNPTEAEKVMWEYLRNKKTGHKIRRQHIIDDFIPDFVCLSKKIIIEIDGKIHLQQKEQDELRTARLNELGYEVIRFTNEEVFANPELVALKTKEKLDSKVVSPPLEGLGEVFAPIDILDYIYAVLHSPTYREKYKEFLKIDFPRVPYPKDKATFWQLVKLGGEIRQIHLLESPIVEKYITQYPIDGDNVVIKPRFVVSAPLLESLVEIGKVYINDTQYFDNVPQTAWDFYIGGYQPAQKWLKDRKERKLEFDDIFHYQKIIVALFETDRLMKEIDKIEIE